MTDLQRHLKGIRSIVSQAIAQPSEPDSLTMASITEKLRAFLPRSYGLGSGQIISESGLSESVPLLIYDVPLANGLYSEESREYRIEHVLCLIDAVHTYTPDSLSETLDRVASVKHLQTIRPAQARKKSGLPPSQTRATIPKDRLPFSLIMCERFDAFGTSKGDSLFDTLHALLQRHPMAHRPDEINLLSQQAQFTNPLLNRDVVSQLDTGLTRVPLRRKPEYCYVCKQEFMTRHFFYDYLCLACGDLNYHKRKMSVDLQGYRVLVTGARVKIGYAVALRLLRAGAEVIVTSRFPRDTARRYIQESDFAQWGSRLHVYGVDFRSVTSLEQFIQHLYQRYPHIDALINNAAQTVKRPRAFYAHLLPFESTPFAELPAGMQNLLPDSAFAQTALDDALAVSDPAFPAGHMDENSEQVDYRDFNSWVMRLEDVPVSEMIEVHLVNAVAPAILAGQLKHLLMQSPHEARFIVNVAAAEGRFSQFKTSYHPHTNMAKAALNMLTRTIADDYAAERIYVNSVDPGWVSDQIPHTGEMGRLQGLELLPLDMIDAAARVCDPLMTTIQTGEPCYGQLLKDYGVVGW